jgi:PAS domain S-box-containing protein
MKSLVRAGLQRLGQLRPITLTLLAVAFVATLGAMDHSMPGGVSFALLYLLGVTLAGWGAGKWMAGLLALLCAAIMAVDEWQVQAHSSGFGFILAWNALSRWVLFWGAGWLMASLARLNRGLTGMVQESAGQHRTILAAAMDGFAMVNELGRLADVNEAFCRMHGYSREELLGMEVKAIEGEKSPEEIQALLARIRAKGCEQFETRHRRKDGSAIDLEMSLSALPGKEGVFVAFVREIGDRKRAEILLQAQRDLGVRLSHATDLDTALDALLEVAIRLEGIDSGGVYLRDLATGDLRLAALAGPLSPQFVQAASFRPGDSDQGRIVARGQPIYSRYEELLGPTSRSAEPFRAVAVIPLRHEGAIIGSLILASHLTDSIPFQSRIVIEAIAAQATVAIARIRAETERQRLERQILEISDREQSRIGQELHDGLCQQLVSLAFDANSLRNQLARRSRPETALAVRIADYLDQAITETRQLSRGLFPIRLEADGLRSALEELARGTSSRFGIRCSALCEPSLKTPTGAEGIHLFRIAQEAVNNAVRHARAKEIRIQLLERDRQTVLEIQDDGVGLERHRNPHTTGMGLHIMDYRARSVGGVLRLAPGTSGGTSVCCCIGSPEPERSPA